MIRKLLSVITVCLLTLMAPAVVSAASVYEAGVMELMQDSEVKITCSQGVLYVTGGEGEKLEVISLTGRKVVEEQIESPSEKFELNIPRGCYIVKVGNETFKVSL